MNYVATFMAVFSVLGAVDRILGNRFGLAREFERGFVLFGNMALSMIGMIVISPLLAEWMAPAFGVVQDALHIDPSIIPASLFSIDMGGAALAKEVAADPTMGYFNGLVVASMMGCTISFTIPYALEAVPEEKHDLVLTGFLYGIITIPVGCFAAGLAVRLPIVALLLDLLPLVVFSAVLAVGILLCPRLCVKVFKVFGIFIKIVITVGLAIGIVRFLTGFSMYDRFATLEEGAMVCVNAAVTMSGAFPFLYIVSRLLRTPLRKIGDRMGVNENSALGVISSLATSVTTFSLMKDMDEKGTVYNAAFAVSGAFTFAGCLAFTLAFEPSFLLSVIIGKLVSGFAGLMLAMLMYKRNEKKA